MPGQDFILVLRRFKMPRANRVDWALLVCSGDAPSPDADGPHVSQSSSDHFPVRSFQTGLPLLSRNIRVSEPLTISRARMTSDPSCLTFEPVTAISSPLLKLIPISS